jgi:hypothetical protein
MIRLCSSVADKTPAAHQRNRTHGTPSPTYTVAFSRSLFIHTSVSSTLLFPHPRYSTRPHHSFIYICSRQLCFVSQTAYYRCKISHSYSKFYIPVLPLIYSAPTSIYALPPLPATKRWRLVKTMESGDRDTEPLRLDA